MKTKEQFYNENIESIKDIEDIVFDLTLKMEKECGKQRYDESLNIAWSSLYEICKKKR